MPTTPSPKERVYLLNPGDPSPRREPGRESSGQSNQPVCTESDIQSTIQKFNQLPANERQAIAMSTEITSQGEILIQKSFEDISKATGLNEAEVPKVLSKMSILEKRTLEILIPESDGVLSKGAALRDVMPESRQAARISGLMKNGAELDQYVLVDQVPNLQKRFASQLVEGTSLSVTVPGDNLPSSPTFQKQPQQQQQSRYEPRAADIADRERISNEIAAERARRMSIAPESGAVPKAASIGTAQGKVLEMPEGSQLKQGTIYLSTGGAEPSPHELITPPQKLGPQLVQKAPTGPTASPKSNLIEMPGPKTAPKIAGAPPHEVPAGASRVTHLAEAPHEVNTAARLTTAERGVGGLSRGMEIGGAFAPLALGGLAGGVGAAMDGKSGKEIAVATGKGAIEGGFGVSDAKVALDKHQRLADRLLAGGRSATATTATVAGVASLSGAAAPVTAPIAAAAGVANLGLGIVQDIAHWTGLANNPGTIGQMSALLDEYQRLTQNNKTGIQPDKVAKENYINAVQSGDPSKANEALTNYESHLMHRYQENAMLTNDPAKKKQAADAFKLADKLAHHIYDSQQKNNFLPITVSVTPSAMSQQIPPSHHKVPGLS